jgi:homoserine O-acetyltransferase
MTASQRSFGFVLGLLAWIALGSPSLAQDWPVRQGDHVINDFTFEDGATLQELRLHYRTLGEPRRDASGRVTNAVMVLHGTGGTGAQFLRPQFADELFGPGQPLDITRYYIILPDNIGHGGSSKPSDGLRATFPEYTYDDMVEAQRRLLVEGLGVDHLRLIMGTSMGCMHAFVWGEAHPDFADALMPLACQPTEIAGRNRLWRAMLMDAIRSDPAWMGGDYESQPVEGLRTAADLLMLVGAAPMAMQADLPDRVRTDAWLAEQLPGRIAGLDANDLWYQVNSSRDYDPSAAWKRSRCPSPGSTRQTTSSIRRNWGWPNSSPRAWRPGPLCPDPGQRRDAGTRHPHLGAVLAGRTGGAAGAVRTLGGRNGRWC